MKSEENLTTEQLFSRTKQRLHLLIKRQAVAGGIAMCFGLLMWANAFQFAEWALLDGWLSRPQSARASDVMLIPISQKSINQIGKWPWPPFRHAVILELLSRWGVRAVYIDHSFSEVWWEDDQKSLNAVLEKQEIPIFFGADYKEQFENTGQGLVGLNSLRQEKMQWVLPNKEISKNALIGHRLLVPDSDRVFRFWAPWFEGAGQKYPAAGLKMAVQAQKEFKDASLLKPTQTKPRLIPWNRRHFNQWTRVEFADLMQSYLAIREGMQPSLAPQLFENKTVFIGLADETQTLSGLTPWHQTAFPVEVMAAIYDGLMGSRLPLRWVMPQGVVWIAFLLSAALLTFWTGSRTGPAFWIGWFSAVIIIVLIWVTELFFRNWFPCATVLSYFSIAGAGVFAFDAVYARQERSALFYLATRDGLTNLYVIRHFRVILNQMTREACARKEALSVILMDIDHFKKINDTYGHPAGDMVLKKTADVIQAAIRQKREFKDVDFVARYGGEEFIILIRRNQLETVAEKIAERIRIAIETTYYEWNRKRILVTASFGVSVLNQDENIPDAMVHRADKALYLAKQKGRNQVCTEEDLRNA